MTAAPLTATIAETCVMLGLGRTSVDKLISSGELRSRTIGRRRLVIRASIFELLGEKDVAA